MCPLMQYIVCGRKDFLSVGGHVYHLLLASYRVHEIIGSTPRSLCMAEE